VFDITVDGQLLFSKHDQGRFPTESEIVELITRRAE
jgi:selT/selW/selH-like putative selenoprotein